MPSEFQEYFAEGSFKVKFSTIWTDAAAEVGRVREEKRGEERRREEKRGEEERRKKKKEERRKKKEETRRKKKKQEEKKKKKKKKKEEENRGKSKEDQRRERVRRKTIQAHEMIEKSRNTVVLQCFAAREGRLAKTAGAEPSRQMRDQKLHPAVARSRFGCQKHTIVGALLEVEPFKKCTRLWREAHFEF